MLCSAIIITVPDLRTYYYKTMILFMILFFIHNNIHTHTETMIHLVTYYLYMLIITRYTGSLLNLTGSPAFVDLLTSTRTGALAPLGEPYASSCFMNGYVISKPGRGRRLYWHQDWWGWDRVESYHERAPMFAMMTYLTETAAPARSDGSDGNGCLRVIPGTHRKRHRLHNRVPDAHGDAISFGSMDGPAFDYEVEGAVDVPMKPGDAAIVDVRVLHATRDNNTDERRSMITCWWVPTGPTVHIPEVRTSRKQRVVRQP